MPISRVGRGAAVCEHERRTTVCDGVVIDDDIPRLVTDQEEPPSPAVRRADVVEQVVTERNPLGSQRHVRVVVPGHVHDTGRVPDDEAARLLAGCQALVVTAVEEFGLAAVEAQAAGRPVITIGAGGALETVIEGKTGAYWHGGPAELAAAVTSRPRGNPNWNAAADLTWLRARGLDMAILDHVDEGRPRFEADHKERYAKPVFHDTPCSRAPVSQRATDRAYRGSRVLAAAMWWCPW